MFSNTENNSASDSVKTRPRLKAYLNFIFSWLKNNQQKTAVIAGYILTAGLFFGLGKYTSLAHPPSVEIIEPAVDLTQVYNSLNQAAGQAPGVGEVRLETVAGASTTSDCTGKIKGNISGKNKIYHMPGGAFYARTQPEQCFNTEAEAKAAGFRKSLR